MNWISVEERLPSDDEYVLVHSINGTEIGLFFHSYFTDFNDNAIYDITHWMPLPEPPED